MIESKLKIGETKVSVRKVILTAGRNVSVKTGMTQIYIEVISFYADKTRKTKRIPTGVYVKPRDFNKKIDDGCVLSSDPDHIVKNNKINLEWGNYIRLITTRETETYDPSFNPKNLVSLDDLLPKKSKSLLDYLDEYYQYRKDTNTPWNTLKQFGTLKSRIERYETDKNVKLTFSDMNMTFSDSFYSFLVKEKFMSGSIEKTFSLLRTFLNFYFEKKDELNIDLSDKFRSKNWKKGTKSGNEPNVMSQQEFDLLVNHTFKTESLNKTKDRFLLGCSTGMRYSDLFNITKDNIKNDVLVYYPQKTQNKKNNRVECPLNDISRSILEKYNYDTTQLSITNQKYNTAIENMFKVLDEEHPNIFRTDYTSHNSRDFFISTCIKNGFDVPSLLKVVGQSDWDTMSRYFQTTTEHIKNKMKDIPLFNKK